jgi:hypothetical protein
LASERRPPPPGPLLLPCCRALPPGESGKPGAPCGPNRRRRCGRHGARARGATSGVAGRGAAAVGDVGCQWGGGLGLIPCASGGLEWSPRPCDDARPVRDPAGPGSTGPAATQPTKGRRETRRLRRWVTVQLGSSSGCVGAPRAASSACPAAACGPGAARAASALRLVRE